MDNGSEYTPDKRKMTENSKEESKETRGSRSKDKSKKLPWLKLFYLSLSFYGEFFRFLTQLLFLLDPFVNDK